jgi:hypothetical protein
VTATPRLTPRRIYRTARFCFAAMVLLAIVTVASHDSGDPGAMVTLTAVGMSMAGALHLMRRNNPRTLAMRPWRAPRTMDGLGEMTAQWALRQTAQHPGYHGGPDAETDAIAESLARLNRAGMVTVQSQPQRDGQYAFVHGFCARGAMERVRDAAAAAGLETHIERGVPRRRHTDVVVGEWAGAPDVYRFPESRREFLAGWAASCAPEAVKELAEAWQVLVVDPRPGDPGRMWRILTAALEN